MSTRDPLAKHQKHLMQPSDAFLKEKLGLLGLTPEALAKAPPVIVSGLKKNEELRIHPTEKQKSKLVDVASHTAYISPKSLDELKELVGVPNRFFEKGRDQAPHLREVDPKAVQSIPAKITLSKLSDAQRSAFFATAHNLVNGPTDSRMLARANIKAVSAAALGIARNLTIFFAPDLVVLTGQTVSFASYAVLYFNNVVVYGTGTIRTGDGTKLHAYQIKHV